jgi:hypothetical protein
MPYYRVPIMLCHHGSTDAFNVRMFGNAFTDKNRQIAFSANEQVHIPSFIRPTKDHVAAYLRTFFPDEDQAKVDSGDLSFHVCGKVTYEDIYGKAQETTFWYVWDMEVIDVGGVLDTNT